MRSALVTYVLVLAAGATTQAPNNGAPSVEGNWRITSMITAIRQ